MAPKVLIVEDEPELRTALRVRLSASGFACETAGNGKEALAAMQRSRPDVVVADLLMPVMDGYALCRRIREDQGLADVPVIVLSAVPRHAIEGAESLQASRIMAKPFDARELVKVIQALLREAALGG
ncbi:MAG: response regulator [Candidatus Omnitrophica bacterium]|nr:response regulator [Candidatus Omnitrophota bacterium]